MSSIVLLDIALLTGLMLLGVPVAMAFAAAVLLLFATGNMPNPGFLIGAGFTKASSIIMIAIPLYIIAGGIMSQGGIANRLIDLVETLIGRSRGRLGFVTVVATAIFGAISGMASSAVATIGSIMIPRMVSRGYPAGLAASLVAASAVLALLIPPSGAMILYGWVTGTSITASFLAPVVPGLLLVLLLGLCNLFLLRGMKGLPPEAVAPPRSGYRREAARALRKGALAVGMPVIILGAIYGGVATPTEAAAIAVVYALPVSLLIYRDIGLGELWTVLWKAGQTTGVLIVLVFFASMLSRLYTMENVPQQVLDWFLSVSDDPLAIMILVNLFLLLIGMFMDDASGILLASPLLLPVVQHVGVDPVQFAAIIAVNLGMGLITPPCAPMLYFAGSVGRAHLSQMLKPTLVFICFAYLPVVLLTTYVPQLSLWLPTLLLK